MHRLFLLSSTLASDPLVRAWLHADSGALAELAQRHFALLRACGADVGECLHDGQATACVGGAAFAYVARYRAQVNLGFFHGSALPDPAGLLQGKGRCMRHVKLHPGREPDAQALQALIAAAYRDIRQRLGLC